MITITDKQLIFIDDSGSRPAVDGDDMNACYYQITLSNGYISNISASWDDQTITDEVTAVIASQQAQVDQQQADWQAAQNLLNSL